MDVVVLDTVGAGTVNIDTVILQSRIGGIDIPDRIAKDHDIQAIAGNASGASGGLRSRGAQYVINNPPMIGSGLQINGTVLAAAFNSQICNNDPLTAKEIPILLTDIRIGETAPRRASCNKDGWARAARSDRSPT